MTVTKQSPYVPRVISEGDNRFIHWDGGIVYLVLW